MNAELLLLLSTLVFCGLWLKERAARKRARDIVEQLREERDLAERRRLAMPFYPSEEG